MTTKWMKDILAAMLMVLAIGAMSSCGDDGDDDGGWQAGDNANSNSTVATVEAGRLEFPRLRDDGSSIVVVHSTTQYGVNYAVEWDCDKRAQRWSCYQLHAGNSVTNWNRNNWRGAYWQGQVWTGDPFQEDPSLPTCCRTTLDDYRGSGFNRGHICPSADRLCSQEANGQTFYLSNMQPQYYNFNSGIWLDMENQLRSWNTNTYRDTLYVCKGGTIEDYGDTNAVLTRTSTGMLVPRYFFMALLCKRGSTYKALGFWAEHSTNDHSGEALSGYVVSIDELERLTGIDFFCNLPDDIEQSIEGISRDAVIRAWGLRK